MWQVLHLAAKSLGLGAEIEWPDLLNPCIDAATQLHVICRDVNHGLMVRTEPLTPFPPHPLA